jgi:hypothetical protein
LFINISNADERTVREEIFDHGSPNLRIFLFQQANDIRRILFHARRSLVLLEFLECRFGFADANRQLMTSSALVEDTPGNYKNCGLVGDSSEKRINFEEVI